MTGAGTITKTVVAKYFARDVQRWSAQVSQRHYEIKSALISLESQFTGMLPQSYSDWATQRDAMLNQLYSAPREHVIVVKETVNAC